MRKQDKNRILMTTILIGLISVMMVVLAAYAAELRVENNALMSQNSTLQGEIDTLNVKVKTANNIEHIETVATGELGMVYPTEGQCVYVSSSDEPSGNFATVIKKQAYN